MRDGSETNARIRQAALALFVERGVSAVSVRDIAEAAGVRPSTLYVHWPSRDALVEDLFRTGFAAYARRIEAAADGDAPLPERLALVVRTVCRLYAEDQLLFRFLLLTQHINLASMTNDQDNPIEMLERLVAKAHAAGVTAAFPPKLLTAAMVGIVVQAATFHIYGRLKRDPARLEDELTRLCLRTVLP
ncbi:MAG TPA: TetR/AcrR family transcriptional regulator [Stellaceae bacterium]|nr:TetR/AcrR family transcriptional regulator [Stellaceae bacterium]